MSRKLGRIILIIIIISIGSFFGGLIILKITSPSYHLDYARSTDLESLPTEIPENLYQKEFEITQDDCCGHVDVNPPIIELLSPANNSETNSGALINLNIFEIDTELNQVLYHWNDNPSNITLDTPYDVIVPDEEGTLFLYVYAEDSVANWASVICVFTIPNEQTNDTSIDDTTKDRPSTGFLALPVIIAIISTVTIFNRNKRR